MQERIDLSRAKRDLAFGAGWHSISISIRETTELGSYMIPIDRLQMICEESLKEIVAANLNCSCSRERSAKYNALEGLSAGNLRGASINLGDEKNEGAFELALLATEEGCNSLAMRVLRLEDGSKLPSEEDIADALGEFLNLVAGAMKGRLETLGGLFGIGFPRFGKESEIFCNGERPEKEILASIIRLGAIETVLIIVREKSMVSLIDRRVARAISSAD